MAVSYDKFLDQRLSEKWSPNVKEADAIRRLFKGTTDSHQAAEEYTEDIRSSSTAAKTGGKLGRIWGLILHLAAQFPDYHPKLVKLMEAIQQLPDLVFRDELAVRWADMPNFGMVCAETVLNWSSTTAEGSSYGPEVNQVAFLAQLTARRVLAMDFLRDSDVFFWAAFEDGPAEGETVTPAAGRLLDVRVPVPAQCIFYAGKLIFECREDMMLPARQGLWTGQPGFGIKRWNFWKSRAEFVANLNNGVVRQETKDVAQRMVDKMNEVEETQYE